jgi:hypothetical protein
MRYLADLVSRVWTFFTTPIEAAPAVPAPVGPSLLSGEAQWGRVASVLETAVQRTSAMRSAHALARDNLQAAEYALDRLLDELADVMVVKPRSVVAPVATLPGRPVAIPYRSPLAA